MANNDAGRSGTDYQINMFALSALQAISSQDEKWILSTEHKKAGKFDDVVFESEESGINILIQCKYKKCKPKEKKKSKGKKKSKNPVLDWKILLPEYYHSYKIDISKSFKKKLLMILCSNIGPSDGDFLQTLKVDIFPVKNKVYKFRSSKIEEVQKILDAFDDHSLKFCEKFRFLHIDESAIEDGIQKKLEDAQKMFGSKFSKLHFKEKIDNLFQGKLQKLRRIGKSHVIAFLYDWRSQDYLRQLDSFKTDFRELYAFGENKIINIVSMNDDFLYVLKIHRSLLKLHNRDQLLFIESSVESEFLDKIIISFELPRYCILVISLDNSNQFRIIQSRLNDILIKRNYKKVIILSKVPIQEDIIKEEIKFSDLTKACQITLLLKEVDFQGKYLPIEKIINNSVNNIDSIIDQRNIKELIYGKNIKIGKAIKDLGEIEQYYMERKFILETKDTLYEFTEQDICNFVGQPEKFLSKYGKFFLISDRAGMGKTTILTKLGSLIKKVYPHIFLISVDLNKFTSIFKEFQRANKQSVDLEDMIQFEDENHFENSFNKNIFSNTKNIILMVDAVDEISPDYNRLVQNFILQTSQRDNISKIFVTTRPHLTTELESFLNTKSYGLIPFSNSEQTDLLKKYWNKNSIIDDDEELTKCEDFAKTLRSKIECSIGNNSCDLMGIPLQTMMIAEIFQGLDDKESKWVPDQLNITELYDRFVERKGEIFIRDKCNIQDNVGAREIYSKYYEDAKIDHQKLAARLLLKDHEYSLMNISKNVSNIHNESLLRMGMLQKIGDKLLFVHQTFAEYFLAKAMWQQLKEIKKPDEFLMFLLKDLLINREFEVIRAFFENILTTEYSRIPKKLLEICGSTVDSITWDGSKNINHLAREGRKNILKVMLDESQKSEGVSEERKKLLHFVDETTGRTALSEALEFQEIIDFLLNKGANVNQRDKHGCRILHYAAKKCKIELVRHLVRSGATINVADNRGFTPLHLSVNENYTQLFFYFIESSANVNTRAGKTTPLYNAMMNRNFEMVKELTKMGADIHEKDVDGMTALHYAAYVGNINILKHLLREGARVNDRDNYGGTPLHWAAEHGHLDCLQSLVDGGGDVNILDDGEQSILDVAIFHGEDEIVKYLHD